MSQNPLEASLGRGEHHSFAVADAVTFGIPQALLLKTIRFWLHANRAAGRNFFDGRTWTFNTVAAWAVLFPYWTRHQTERVFERLRAAGVLLAAHHAEDQRVRTLSYSLSDAYLRWWAVNADASDPAPYLMSDEAES